MGEFRAGGEQGRGIVVAVAVWRHFGDSTDRHCAGGLRCDEKLVGNFTAERWRRALNKRVEGGNMRCD